VNFDGVGDHVPVLARRAAPTVCDPVTVGLGAASNGVAGAALTLSVLVGDVARRRSPVAGATARYDVEPAGPRTKEWL
jgi:hypothetical protein